MVRSRLRVLAAVLVVLVGSDSALAVCAAFGQPERDTCHRSAGHDCGSAAISACCLHDQQPQQALQGSAQAMLRVPVTAAWFPSRPLSTHVASRLRPALPDRGDTYLRLSVLIV